MYSGVARVVWDRAIAKPSPAPELETALAIARVDWTKLCTQCALYTVHCTLYTVACIGI